MQRQVPAEQLSAKNSEQNAEQSANRDFDSWADDGVKAELEAAEANFKPLTRAEAESIRRANPPASMLKVLGCQLLASLAVALLVGVVTGRASAAWSALYGGMAVWVPAALFARGLQRQAAVGDAGSALIGFFVWELVKVVLTVALLLAAPQLVEELSWLALVAGFVVTMKVYWVAMWLHLVRTNAAQKAVNEAALRVAPKNG